MRVILASVFLVAAVPTVEAQYCDWESDGSFRCGWGDGPSENSSNLDALDVFLGLLALAITIGAAIFGYIKVKQRRATVGAYLRRLEQTYAEKKSDPANGLPELVSLRDEVRQRYVQGRLEDAPFLELEKRIVRYISRLRTMEVEERFPGLPPKVMDRLETVLSDGSISDSDVEVVGKQATRSRVAKKDRESLQELLQWWANQDLAAAS